ncbi:hypothetical protein HC723_17105 [Vibrio sp. S11_S32]|uniref:DUF6444 domain-containing protein n=1 Tax=Vibrio sp. S11_S32 TaxID=2720225 RepID=UPI0016805DB7|nr:DUF6444 domain-containing protein [Vibrio sp. S11_S32]MBD1578085.1 hypothetical protein [Vibrio sp. S11_S32]
MLHYLHMSRKKEPKYQAPPPVASSLNEANTLIQELWEQLRHLEDKRKTNSKNSSKPSSTESIEDKANRKKQIALVMAIREELHKVTKGINENSQS